MKIILLGLIAAIVSVGKCGSCQIVGDSGDEFGTAVGKCMEVVATDEAGNTNTASMKVTCSGTTPTNNLYIGAGCSGDDSIKQATDGTCVTIDECVTIHMKIDTSNANYTGTNCDYQNYMKLSMGFNAECEELNSTHSAKMVCVGRSIAGELYAGTSCAGDAISTETAGSADMLGSCVEVTCGAAEMMVYSVFLVLAAMISFM
eukprot:740855_1